MASKEEILNFVKFRGPVIPNQIKKQFGGDTYVISAILSEFTANGQVKVTNTKVGGSPAYYTPGQELKLLDLKKYLNEKDQRTVDLLREKKVLRDNTQEMLVRVSLRSIKDFAKLLEVNIKGEKEVFWKWYLTPTSEAEKLIKEQLANSPPKTVETELKNSEVRSEIKQTEVKKEEYKTEADTKKEVEKKVEETQEQLSVKKEMTIPKEGFGKQVYDYFEEKNIEVIEEEIIRKNSELEFIISIPSAVGKVEYFCKAKNKKKCNDGDLSSAYLKGQTKKLPVIFITTGEVTKKALEKINNEFKGLVIKQI